MMPKGQYDRNAAPIVPPVELVPPGESWRGRAACRDHSTLPAETWDDTVLTPEGVSREAGSRGAVHRAKRIAAAIKVCKTECPVRAECLRDVDLEWDEGVRAGIDLRELLRAKSRKRKAS